MEGSAPGFPMPAAVCDPFPRRGRREAAPRPAPSPRPSPAAAGSGARRLRPPARPGRRPRQSRCQVRGAVTATDGACRRSAGRAPGGSGGRRIDGPAYRRRRSCARVNRLPVRGRAREEALLEGPVTAAALAAVQFQAEGRAGP